MLFSTVKFFNAGLGNLLIPMSKAYLASQALNCNLLIPFQLDTLRMKAYFNPIKMGFLPYLPNPLKKVVFTFEDYKHFREITNTNDYYDNVKAFVEKNEYKNIILINEGMWGGYYAIYRARKWIKTFLMSNRHARKNMGEVGSCYHPNRIQIGFHIRKGDFKIPSFSSQQNNKSSVWNVQIPMEWYYHISEQLIKEFKADKIDFVLFTDSKQDKDISNFISRFKVISKKNKKGLEFSDLYLMSECDLLICSNSSYSMMGAFLSESPYLLFKEYAIKKDGRYLLWDEDIYNYDFPLKRDNPRGSLLGIDEKIDEKLILYLNNKIKQRNSINKELIFGGKTTG
jgi:hypothetical protein